jgi:hypothetical protein
MRTVVRPHRQLNAFGSSRRYCATSLYGCGLNGLTLREAGILDVALRHDIIYLGSSLPNGLQAPVYAPSLVSLAGKTHGKLPAGAWYRQYRGGGIHHRSNSSAQAAQKTWHTAK